ncbi:MAG: hypothetical protein LUH40_04270 [Clostridiales bacterium]|nr:hypothetical protein [Clostridiales bacterium]
MKKAVSVLLALILSFSVLAVCASAATGDYQTYYVEFDIKSSGLNIVPVDGYTQYVLPGEDFKFTVEADEGYTDTFTIVEVDMVGIEPDVHGVYTISDINADTTITVYVTMDESSSNLFSSLIVLVHNILEWFMNIINSIRLSLQT